MLHKCTELLYMLLLSPVHCISLALYALIQPSGPHMSKQKTFKCCKCWYFYVIASINISRVEAASCPQIDTASCLPPVPHFNNFSNFRLSDTKAHSGQHNLRSLLR